MSLDGKRQLTRQDVGKYGEDMAHICIYKENNDVFVSQCSEVDDVIEETGEIRFSEEF